MSPEWELGDIAEILRDAQPMVLFATDGEAVRKLRILGGIPECLQNIVVLERPDDPDEVISFSHFLADGGLLDTAERAARLRAGARSLAGDAIATLETKRESGKLLREPVDHRTMVEEIEALVVDSSPRTEGDRILSSLRPERRHRATLYAGWADGLTRTVFAVTPAARDNLEALPLASRPDGTKPPMILEKNETSKLRRNLRGWISSLAAAMAKHASKLGWHAFQTLNTRIPASPSIHPDWAPRPLLKSHERTKPPLGWPRETDSLCPDCVIEARDAVVSGERSLTDMLEKRSGEIPARIIEEDGRLLIRKHCEEH